MIEIFNYLTPRYYIRYYFLKNLPKFLYEYILKMKCKRLNKRNLNLKNPIRLSDKIQWVKIYNKDKRKTILSDKILVKQFVLEKIPELKVAKIYQTADSFNNLDIVNLPEKFILKTNHAWKTNIKIENKSDLTQQDLEKISKYYKKMLKVNYAYWSYYELQYKNITPKIFAEEFIGNTEDINHYEVWCFNGVVEFVSLRFLTKEGEYKNIRNEQYFFNSEWKLMDFCIGFKNEGNPKLSINKDKIIEYAEILSFGINFVRVDFMEVNNELYFGEMTFTPSSGFFKFIPDSYDFIFGNKLILSN